MFGSIPGFCPLDVRIIYHSSCDAQNACIVPKVLWGKFTQGSEITALKEGKKAISYINLEGKLYWKELMFLYFVSCIFNIVIILTLPTLAKVSSSIHIICSVQNAVPATSTLYFQDLEECGRINLAFSKMTTSPLVKFTLAWEEKVYMRLLSENGQSIANSGG